MSALFGKVVERPVQDPHSFNKDAAIERTQKLWTELYPNEAFELNLESFNELSETPLQTQDNPETSSGINFDFSSELKKQRSFFFQVDRDCMRNTEYMKGALTRYRLFLHLILLNPGMFLVPTYDVDLLWHAHMMNTKRYMADTANLFGTVLEHDTSETLRGPGSKLELGYRSMERLWNKTYGVPYSRAGAMHRGPLPAPLPKAAASLRPGAHSAAGPGLPFSSFASFDAFSARLVFHAHVTVWGVSPAPWKKPLFVRLTALEACPSLRLDSTTFSPAGQPYWSHTWSLHCESASCGLSLAVLSRPTTVLEKIWGDSHIGSASVLWSTVQEQPALFLDRQLPLSGIALLLTEEKPRLHVSVSLTPPELGPFLLRTVFTWPSDDGGCMVNLEVMKRRGLAVQEGRWVSRTVLDHRSQQVLVVRKRVACGAWQGKRRPYAAPVRERVIVVHRGGWTYVEEGQHLPPMLQPVGYVEGEVLVQAVPQNLPGSDFSSEQRFCLIGEGHRTGLLTVRRDASAQDWADTLQFELQDESGCPACLLRGRHLQYRVGVQAGSEDRGYVTLVRFPPWSPGGVATAVFNWQQSAMECSPLEQPLLVLLLMVTVSEAVQEMLGNSRMKPFRDLRVLETDRQSQWGALVACRSDQQANSECSGVEVDGEYWWSDRCPSKKGSRGGNCGAGACGPSLETVDT